MEHEENGRGSSCAPQTEAERRRRARLAVLRDALDLLVGVAFGELSEHARVLCVGVGSGSELVRLGRLHPGWRFTVVDPDPEALETSRVGWSAAGLGDRCRFEETPIESFGGEGAHDAATSLLVSHWIRERRDRVAYFAAIERQLRPGAPLVNADLALESSAASDRETRRLWRRTLDHFGLPGERFDTIAARMGLVPASEVEALLVQAGFDAPVPLYRALLLHGWVARSR